MLELVLEKRWGGLGAPWVEMMDAHSDVEKADNWAEQTAFWMVALKAENSVYALAWLEAALMAVQMAAMKEASKAMV